MIFKFNATKKELYKRQTQLGFADLLSYLFLINENTILHKDGSLSRSWQLKLPNLSTANATEKNFASDSWQQSIRFLNDGWLLEINVVSQSLALQPAATYCKQYAAYKIQQQRQQQLEDKQYFSNTYVLTLSYKNNTAVAHKLHKFALHKQQNHELDLLLHEFNTTSEQFIQYLQRTVIDAQVLRGQQLISFIYNCIYGSNRQLAMPYEHALLSCYLSDAHFIGGLQPQINNNYIATIAINDLPTYSYPLILNELSYLPINYRFHSRFVCLNENTAQNYLRKYQKNWSAKAIGFWGVMRESFGVPAKINTDAQQTAHKIEQNITANSSGNLSFGFYNSCIVLMAKNSEKLKQLSNNITHRIQKLNFKARLETINAVESYLGSLPSHGGYNLRRIFIDNKFLAHALPISANYDGETKAPCNLAGYKNQQPLRYCISTGNRPFALNLHVEDVGHTAILGPTGSGKSTLLGALMLSHQQYENSQIVVLDKDFSHKLLITALHGQYIDLNESNFALSPCNHDNDTVKQWLHLIFSAQNICLSTQQKQEISDAVNRLRLEELQYQNLHHLTLQEPILRSTLQQFNSGKIANIINGTQNNIDNRVLAIEIGSILAQPQNIAVPIIQAIFNQLHEIFMRKNPTLFILEEAWLYLQHDYFAQKLADWFKTLRKANVAVLFVSQDLTDIAHSAHANTIQSSCLTRIYLPNKHALEPSIAASYKKFGLKNRQIHCLSQATPKQDYYYSSALGSRLFNLQLTAAEKSLLCVAHKEHIAKFYEIFSTHKDWWSLWQQYWQQQHFTNK